MKKRKDMINKYNQFISKQSELCNESVRNESVRDLMKPKSVDTIMANFKDIDIDKEHEHFSNTHLEYLIVQSIYLNPNKDTNELTFRLCEKAGIDFNNKKIEKIFKRVNEIITLYTEILGMNNKKITVVSEPTIDDKYDMIYGFRLQNKINRHFYCIGLESDMGNIFSTHYWFYCFDTVTGISVDTLKELKDSIKEELFLDVNESVRNESVRDLMKPKSKEEIKLALKNPKTINKKDDFGYSKLMVAAWKRDWDMVEFLIDNGADINTVDSNGQSILFVACADGNLDMVKYLVEKGINYNIEDSEGNNAIILAQWNEHWNVVDYLKSIRKPSLLNSLLKTNESVGSLMKPKSEEDIRKKLKNMPLDEKLRTGCEEGLLYVVKDAIEEGADINSLDGIAIQLASSNGHIEIVKYLIQQGADIHRNDELALRWACGHRHTDIMKLLLDNGADVNKVTGNDMIGTNAKQMFKILKQYGTKMKSIYERKLTSMTPFELRKRILNNFDATPEKIEELVDATKNYSIGEQISISYALGIVAGRSYRIKMEQKYGIKIPK
jgi:ankyrin repeat protein